MSAGGWAQADQENLPGLNIRRDSAGQIVAPNSSTAPPIPARTQHDPLEILSDTQGVDFGPYLHDRVLPTVRSNWYAVIPASAQMKKGKVAIEFAVKRDGRLAGMKLVASSGDVILDRAAWSGITASDPLPSLPLEFKGEYVALRFSFFYNPEKGDLEETNAPAAARKIVHAVPMPHESDLHPPKYPKAARKAKAEGIVRLDVDVDVNGRVKEVKVVDGNSTLAEASTHAIRQWRFYPAQRDGAPVEDRARIRVDFRLEGESVKAQLVSYLPAPNPAK